MVALTSIKLDARRAAMAYLATCADTAGGVITRVSQSLEQPQLAGASATATHGLVTNDLPHLPTGLEVSTLGH